jgi:hypothetical protein
LLNHAPYRAEKRLLTKPLHGGQRVSVFSVNGERSFIIRYSLGRVFFAFIDLTASVIGDSVIFIKLNGLGEIRYRRIIRAFFVIRKTANILASR